jgi:hypothetical protein
MKLLKFLSILTILILSLKAEAQADTPPDAADPPKADSAGDDSDSGDESGEKKEAVVGHCNKALLEAYDLESGWETVEDKNLLCPSIKKLNCCSYHAQLDIFRKWVLKGEREKILKTYR